MRGLFWSAREKNAIQARLTDETGVIISWDDYAINHADIQLVESVRLSVSGRNQIVFTPHEELVIDRYGDYDRNTTKGKLDILSGRFKDPDIEAAAVSVTQKLGRISDQSYADMYAVGQTATVYTRDKTVMRRLDALVIEYPDHYRLIGETDIDKTYEMPKSFVSYRKPRRLSEEQREAARSRAKALRDR